MFVRTVSLAFAVSVCFVHHQLYAQVVDIRLATTTLDGSPVDAVNIGDQFLLQVFTQQIGGFSGAEEDGGVFAAYLDIDYDASLATPVGEIEHAELYSGAPSGVLSSPGLMDDIGGFSSSNGAIGGVNPTGPDERFVFQVKMQARAAGEMLFAAMESGNYPLFDVLVFGVNERINPNDIQFGSATLSITAVPEPGSAFLLGFAMTVCAIGWKRALPSQACAAERLS